MNCTVVFFVALTFASCRSSERSGNCVKDTDCKGDRVCVNGACQAPEAATKPGSPATGQRTATVTPPPQNRNGVVRAEPSLSAAKVTELPRGTRVTILYVSSDGAWRRIRWNVEGANGEGWIHRDVLSEGT